MLIVSGMGLRKPSNVREGEDQLDEWTCVSWMNDNASLSQARV